MNSLNERRSYCLCRFSCVGFCAADELAPKPVDWSEAYYNYAMGHLYGELAAAYGNSGQHIRA
jgi:hypothetical protein